MTLFRLDKAILSSRNYNLFVTSPEACNLSSMFWSLIYSLLDLWGSITCKSSFLLVSFKAASLSLSSASLRVSSFYWLMRSIVSALTPSLNLVVIDSYFSFFFTRSSAASFYCFLSSFSAFFYFLSRAFSRCCLLFCSI